MSMLVVEVDKACWYIFCFLNDIFCSLTEYFVVLILFSAAKINLWVVFDIEKSHFHVQITYYF